MYITKYWGNFIGGTDDSLTLISYLADKQKEECPLCEIFADTGLDRQNGVFRQTVSPLEVTRSDGLETEFYFAIDLMTDLAGLLLECRVSGGISLRELDETAPDRVIRITATPEEHRQMNEVLADFAAEPLSYDLSEMVPVEDMLEMAKVCGELRKELYG